MTGLMIAAPRSGSGKTTVTLGLLRALKRRGVALAPGKAGPDYIDPAFHAAASGEACLNYDPWAMRSDLLLANASLQSQGGRMLVIEAMMGLFDGAADGSGSAGDLAGLLGLAGDTGDRLLGHVAFGGSPCTRVCQFSSRCAGSGRHSQPCGKSPARGNAASGSGECTCRSARGIASQREAGAAGTASRAGAGKREREACRN
jgi:hypothetical protein